MQLIREAHKITTKIYLREELIMLNNLISNGANSAKLQAKRNGKLNLKYQECDPASKCNKNNTSKLGLSYIMAVFFLLLR